MLKYVKISSSYHSISHDINLLIIITNESLPIQTQVVCVLCSHCLEYALSLFRYCIIT